MYVNVHMAPSMLCVYLLLDIVQVKVDLFFVVVVVGSMHLHFRNICNKLIIEWKHSIGMWHSLGKQHNKRKIFEPIR